MFALRTLVGRQYAWRGVILPIVALFQNPLAASWFEHTDLSTAMHVLPRIHRYLKPSVLLEMKSASRVGGDQSCSLFQSQVNLISSTISLRFLEYTHTRIRYFKTTIPSRTMDWWIPTSVFTQVSNVFARASAKLSSLTPMFRWESVSGNWVPCHGNERPSPTKKTNSCWLDTTHSIDCTHLETLREGSNLKLQSLRDRPGISWGPFFQWSNLHTLIDCHIPHARMDLNRFACSRIQRSMGSASPLGTGPKPSFVSCNYSNNLTFTFQFQYRRLTTCFQWHCRRYIPLQIEYHPGVSVVGDGKPLQFTHDERLSFPGYFNQVLWTDSSRITPSQSFISNFLSLRYCFYRNVREIISILREHKNTYPLHGNIILSWVCRKHPKR